MSLLTRLWRAAWPVRSAASSGAYPEGAVFPDFELSDVSGATHRLGSGLPAVLWFTNLCDDCRSRVPLLQEAVSAGVRVLAVSILPADDPLPREFSRSCAFPILLDPQDIVSKRLGLSHPPGTCPLHNLYVLDALRRVLFRRHLSAVEPDRFRAVWEKLSKHGGDQ